MAVLLLAVPLRPDALVITKAMMAMTIAEIFVDHVVILVHRAPRILALTLDGDEDLIQCHVSPDDLVGASARERIRDRT